MKRVAGLLSMATPSWSSEGDFNDGGKAFSGAAKPLGWSG
jgi:hypothetical protein